MHYVFLFIAIISEVIGTSALKMSDGFSKFLPSVVVVMAYAASFFFLSLTLKKMGIGTTYAIWSGFGIILVVLVGVLYFKESLSMLKIASILLIIVGVIGLNIGKVE